MKIFSGREILKLLVAFGALIVFGTSGVYNLKLWRGLRNGSFLEKL